MDEAALRALVGEGRPQDRFSDAMVARAARSIAEQTGCDTEEAGSIAFEALKAAFAGATSAAPAWVEQLAAEWDAHGVDANCARDPVRAQRAQTYARCAAELRERAKGGERG